MSSQEETHTSFMKSAYPDFVKSLVPLYSGPKVKIRIGSRGTDYSLSKHVLCKQSAYFSAMFEGDFREGAEQSVTLKKIDGVVSARSFEMLIQWLYLGQVNFGELEPKETITSIVEFCRIADMFQVMGMEPVMANLIKAQIRNEMIFDGHSNTRHISSKLIRSATQLPSGHEVRCILAEAFVKGYLQLLVHPCRLLDEAEDVHEFTADLLEALRDTLRTLTIQDSYIYFTDPINEGKCRLPLR